MELTLERRKGDFAKSILGYYEVNGKIFFKTSGYLSDGYWSHGVTIDFKNYPDNTIILTNENSWKNVHEYVYLVKNGEGTTITKKEALQYLVKVPFIVKVKRIDDRYEYSFDYNESVKDTFKAQGARWNPEKKVWWSNHALKLPQGAEVENVN